MPFGDVCTFKSKLILNVMPQIDRAAEELTWERMLGMDGSLVFIEYVFWVATLNVVSITVFGLIPYLLGTGVTMTFGVDKELDSAIIGRSIILLIG